MMIHDLDMACWLLGEKPTEVYATGSCLVDPAIGKAGDIDSAMVILKNASGKFCHRWHHRSCTGGCLCCVHDLRSTHHTLTFPYALKASICSLFFILDILCDDTYGQDTLNEITGKGWWIGRPIELPGSRPLRFEHGNHSAASVASRLTTWPSEHVVKCLCFYHPDDEETLRMEQEHQVQSVYNACLASGHEFLLKLIPPRRLSENSARSEDGSKLRIKIPFCEVNSGSICRTKRNF